MKGGKEGKKKLKNIFTERKTKKKRRAKMKDLYRLIKEK